MASLPRRFENRRFRPYRASGIHSQTPTPAQVVAGANLREQLIADRGGPAMVSTAESMLIDCVVAAKVKLSDAHAYLFSLPRPWCNRKSHTVWRLVDDTRKLEAHLATLLGQLGYERRAEPIEDIRTLVARREAEKAAPEAATEHDEDGSISREEPILATQAPECAESHLTPLASWLGLEIAPRAAGYQRCIER